jgi:hypothetical protein
VYKRQQLGKGLRISRVRPDAEPEARSSARMLTLQEDSDGWKASGTGFTDDELKEIEEQVNSMIASME